MADKKLNLNKKNKILWQSTVHGTSQYQPIDREPLKKKWKRAINQIVDSVVPGANPRRTRHQRDAD